MNYGFIIDNDACIGCHACSTACKSENEVPLGVQRTWVKSVEVGEYPNVRRNFQVTRCNHCANPPCVRICPVTAMYQRTDGIVEFDPDVCIGCKACLQACPYDAIYIDPETHTAAKCHYCAHRVDLGLEPACVVVCPEHAILAGDLDDPDSEIAQRLASSKTTVRKPEQGTAPKLYYIGGEDSAMQPTATERTPASFAWADVQPLHGGDGGVGTAPGRSGTASDVAGRNPGGGAAHGAPGTSQRSVASLPGAPAHRPEMAGKSSKRSASGEAIRRPDTQGVPSGGPIHIGEGRMADQMVQVVYNAQHKVPWHWPVPAYLVTKGISAGLFLLLSLGSGLGLFATDSTTFVASAAVALFFLVATTALLVFDLERPERFLSILTRPQWKSWLVRGAFLLIGFSVLVTLWAAGEWAALLGWSGFDTWRPVVLWAGVPLAVGTAIYTAFLFGQAEGRDLWQSTLLPFHLIVQAVSAGAATLLVMALFMDIPGQIMVFARVSLASALILDLLVTSLGELGMPHASESAARAAHAITKGRYAKQYWWGAVVMGHVLPLGLLLAGHLAGFGLMTGVTAGAFALAGLYVYEHVFVTAPQEIPNS